MTLKDTRDVFALLQANYPDTFKGLPDDALLSMLKLWQQMFAEEPREIVLRAVQAHIRSSTDRFFPPIGIIKEEIRKLTGPDDLSEGEAWAMVSAALRNGIYGYKEEYAKLPPAVQRAVGTPQTLREWAMLDAESVQSVIASNFQRSYRAAAKQEAELAKLPPGFREEMKKLAGAMLRPLELEEGDKPT